MGCFSSKPKQVSGIPTLGIDEPNKGINGSYFSFHSFFMSSNSPLINDW